MFVLFMVYENMFTTKKANYRIYYTGYLSTETITTCSQRLANFRANNEKGWSNEHLTGHFGQAFKVVLAPIC